jgi:hypothetical protein
MKKYRQEISRKMALGLPLTEEEEGYRQFLLQLIEKEAARVDRAFVRELNENLYKIEKFGVLTFNKGVGL